MSETQTGTDARNKVFGIQTGLAAVRQRVQLVRATDSFKSQGCSL